MRNLSNTGNDARVIITTKIVEINGTFIRVAELGCQMISVTPRGAQKEINAIQLEVELVPGGQSTYVWVPNLPQLRELVATLSNHDRGLLDFVYNETEGSPVAKNVTGLRVGRQIFQVFSCEEEVALRTQGN